MKINPNRIIVALSFIGLLCEFGCAIFEPRIEAVPVAEATAQMTPAMQDAMRDLSSPATTAALHRAQASVEAEK